jgi:hypothetical protein
MPKMDDSKPQRPPLALRLGITGARTLRADQLVRIRTQLRDVFALVKAEMERLTRGKGVADAYASEPGAELEPITENTGTADVRFTNWPAEAEPPMRSAIAS